MHARRINQMAMRRPGLRKVWNASNIVGPTLRVPGRAMTSVLVCTNYDGINHLDDAVLTTTKHWVTSASPSMT